MLTYNSYHTHWLHLMTPLLRNSISFLDTLLFSISIYKPYYWTRSFDFLSWPNPHYGARIYSASNRNKWQESPLRYKARSARKAENHAANCELIVYKMRNFRRLTTTWVSTVSYTDSFTFLFFTVVSCIIDLKRIYSYISWINIVFVSFKNLRFFKLLIYLCLLFNRSSIPLNSVDFLPSFFCLPVEQKETSFWWKVRIYIYVLCLLRWFVAE
jgi:hypothetical protein